VSFFSKLFLPLIGATRAPRRSNRALPDGHQRSRNASTDAEGRQVNTEIVTTAARPSNEEASPLGSERTNAGAGSETNPERPSVMRQWVNELTGRNEAPVAALRVPSDAEIAQVATMFPDSRREDIVHALQRSPNIEVAVESLLSSS